MSEGQVPVDEKFLRDFVDLQRKVNDIANSATGMFQPGDMVANFSSAKTGFLLCDGSTILDTDFPALGAYIRANLPAAYIVDGTHVKLPDMRGLVPPGADGSAFILGTATGASTVTLTAVQSGVPVHTHPAPTITIGNESAHTHLVQISSSSTGTTPAGPGNGSAANTFSTSAGTAHTHAGSSSAIAGNTGAPAASSHTNIQPSLPVNWWIKT